MDNRFRGAHYLFDGRRCRFICVTDIEFQGEVLRDPHLEIRNVEMQECRNAGVQECRNAGVQELVVLMIITIITTIIIITIIITIITMISMYYHDYCY